MLKVFLWIAIAGMAVGCSTPQSRSRSNPELLEALPPEEREMVEAGQVDLGFSEEMVLVALGKPDRRYSQVSESGKRIIWAYQDKSLGSRLSFGVGTGIGIGSGGVGGGATVGTGGRRSVPEAVRVTFVEGKVVAIENVGK